MPIYEFLCGTCDDRFEELVSAGSADAVCPRCGAPDAKRVLSQFAQPARVVLSPGQARAMEARRRAMREKRSPTRSGGQGRG